MSRPGMPLLALIWAFWLSAVDGPRRDDGWVTAPTQHTCDQTRDSLVDMVSRSGTRVRVSTCREMTIGELERTRHQPPEDLPPTVLTF